MSEYAQAKRIIKQMRLNKAQAKDVAQRAFDADLTGGRPDIALKCAKEFQLDDERVTLAATVLFAELINRKNYPKALEVARSYNLAHGGDQARQVLQQASQVTDPQGDHSLAEIRDLARTAVDARLGTNEEGAERAIALIEQAKQLRDQDPKIQGRAVFLPEQGEVWLTGDLHGNVKNLRRFVELADLEHNPDRYLVLQEIVHSRLITADNRDLSFVAIMEAIKLVAKYPGRVYYLLGNHDLAVHLNRELVKGGKYLNRYLFRGMAYMYRKQYEKVLEVYRDFVAGMPAAIFAPNGVFMAHSTPKKAFIPSLSRTYLTETAADQPYSKLKPITAMVNGRDYHPDTAEAFADRLECELMLCGHTPTTKGFRIHNDRHLVLDSQHEKGRYVRFDLHERYHTAEELADEVEALWPEEDDDDILVSDDLM